MSGLVRLSQTWSPREAGRVPRRSCHDSSLWLMRRVFFRPWSCTCVEGPLRRDEALKRCRIRSAVPDSRRRSALAVRDCLGITVGGNGTRACGTTDQASQQTCPVSESGMGLCPCARNESVRHLGTTGGPDDVSRETWMDDCHAGASRGGPRWGEGIPPTTCGGPGHEALRSLV